MRQFVVDELRPAEVASIREELDRSCEHSDLVGLYWLRLPEDLLGPEQFSHKDCQPHYTAVEVGDGWVKFEFLVRSRNRIRCDCVRYATPQQRQFVLAFIDRILGDLKIGA